VVVGFLLAFEWAISVKYRDLGRSACLLAALGGTARAQASGIPAPDPSTKPAESEPPEPPVEPARQPLIRRIQIHGFISEGAFWSTDNDYIGKSERGSLELFEAGINFSTEVAERLNAGIQLFARDFGAFEDPPRLDWAYLDYRWRSWLGLRAGIIKMPFGLYNEYSDIDATRTSILLPQSVYSVRTRDVLLSHRGFAIYGSKSLGAGELEYQALLGTLSVPENAITLEGATLDRVDTRYVTGAQVFWAPPIEGLRIGASYLRAAMDFDVTLFPANTAALIAAGLVPADFNGKVVVSQRPVQLAIGSAEYTRGSWMFAAEYSRGFAHLKTSLPTVFPSEDQDVEAFYGLTTYRASSWLELGGYYGVLHADADDRHGRDAKYPERFYAWQRDATVTARFDINDRWLWKVEAHFMDGVASLTASENPKAERYWGMFLARTTVTF
jgi:hypothetical protein